MAKSSDSSASGAVSGRELAAGCPDRSADASSNAGRHPAERAFGGGASEPVGAVVAAAPLPSDLRRDDLRGWRDQRRMGRWNVPRREVSGDMDALDRDLGEVGLTARCALKKATDVEHGNASAFDAYRHHRRRWHWHSLSRQAARKRRPRLASLSQAAITRLPSRSTSPGAC